jgi:hypothetical protein
MQKLLLDLTPLKVGGGIQLALNFLDFINLSDEIQHFVVLVSDKFPFLERLPNNCPVEIFSASPLSRMKQEHFELPKIIKKYNITHTFTFFWPRITSAGQCQASDQYCLSYNLL